MKKWIAYILMLLLCSILLVLPATALVNGKIAFFSARDANEEIFVMNGDKSGQIRLTDTPNNDNSPAWSPDSSKFSVLITMGAIFFFFTLFCISAKVIRFFHRH